MNCLEQASEVMIMVFQNPRLSWFRRWLRQSVHDIEYTWTVYFGSRGLAGLCQTWRPRAISSLYGLSMRYVTHVISCTRPSRFTMCYIDKAGNRTWGHKKH